MITPLEIEEKEFTKSFRGYNEDEVDEFLDQIILDLQGLLVEMDKLKAENEELKKENADHKDSQLSVMNTLDQAKKLMQDISESAEKRADIIIRNARLDAEMIVKDAKNSAYKYSGEGGDLRERVSSFKERFREMLQDELDSLDRKSDDFLSDFDDEFMPREIADELPDVEDVVIDEAVAVRKKAEAEGLSPEEIFAELEKEVKSGNSWDTGTFGASEGASRETVAISTEEMKGLMEKTEKK